MLSGLRRQQQLKLYYNGDITTVAKFKEMQERFPTIDHWMIGRGLIADPLPSMIKIIHLNIQKTKWKCSVNFHDTFERIRVLSGTTHILLKCTIYGNTFGDFFQPT
jgi:tRNA-dihydrouridine synthase